jgi:hypothetical protein
LAFKAARLGGKDMAEEEVSRKSQRAACRAKKAWSFVRLQFDLPKWPDNPDQAKAAFLKHFAETGETFVIKGFRQWKESKHVFIPVNADGQCHCNLFYCSLNGEVYAHGGNSGNINRVLAKLGEKTRPVREPSLINAHDLRDKGKREALEIMALITADASFQSVENPFWDSLARTGMSRKVARERLSKSAREVKKSIQSILAGCTQVSGALDEWFGANRVKYGTGSDLLAESSSF